MVDILHRVGVAAPLDSVYEAVATPEGIARWWTKETTGNGAVGGQLFFRFGETGSFDMEVVENEPSSRVRWRVTAGPEEWVGTEIHWDLSSQSAHTIVDFKHQGWSEPGEFMAHCSTKWATFLMSLKELMETGKGRPAPDDVPISDWH